MDANNKINYSLAVRYVSSHVLDVRVVRGTVWDVLLAIILGVGNVLGFVIRGILGICKIWNVWRVIVVVLLVLTQPINAQPALTTPTC